MEEKKVYTVATAHLDTVWRWNLATTIKEYLPDTVEKNLELIKKYPHYRFNFEGAYRYELIEEYYPELFEEVKKAVASGKWCISGSSYESGDVNIPSPEALFRNILIGTSYFRKKFGKESTDVFLPDCFGFGYALPSIMKHAGLNGFSTQKLSWGSAYEIPFDIGYWQGVDGSKVLACPDARSYQHKFEEDVRGDLGVINKVTKNAYENGIPQTMHLYGDGDTGGAPTEESIKAVGNSIKANETSDLKVIAASSDEIFNDLEKLDKTTLNKLKVWNNELVMSHHGAGAYTSRAISKRFNAQNENLADTAEKACVLADAVGVYKYPKENLTKSWKRVIRHQFHDDLPGTSWMEDYNKACDDYYTSLTEFQNEYVGAVGAIANELDTSFVTECAVIVNNTSEHARTDAVTAHVKLNHNATYVKVLDKDGKELPSQVNKKEGKEFDIVFIATVPPLGYSVFDVVPSGTKCEIKTDLAIREHVIENKKYRLILNKNGDIGSLYDKELKKQLLDGPIKMAVLNDVGSFAYPSWEIIKDDIDKEPEFYANSPKFEIVENGPARVSLKVTRTANHTTITQILSLSSGSNFVRVFNDVDWKSRRSMLKAVFPFSCYNRSATYDLGLGVIKRDTNTKNLYEVPAQKWADITAGNKAFGVSVFSDCKYGWDKPAGNTLRLTCIHTPAGAFTKETRQDLQDLGKNIFSFGIYSHSGEYVNGTQKENELFQKPLIAFQTSARRKGSLGNDFSFAKINNPNVIIRAIKQAEDDNSIIIRVNEGSGAQQNRVQIEFFTEIESASEVLASEKVIKDAKTKGKKLIFDIKPFGVKSFKINLKKAEKKGRESFKKLELECNSKGFTSKEDKRNVILQGGGYSLPADLYPAQINVGGVTFKLTDPSAPKDVLVAREQNIDIPKGSTKLYMLAASTLGDKDVTFYVDGREKTITIHSFTEPLARWDMAGLDQTALTKDVTVGLEFSHLHHPEGTVPNVNAKFYVYELNVRNGKVLTLPEDNRIIILAMTAVKKFSNTSLATQLLDKVNNRGYDFGDIPPIDKIVDRADAITIRAGKIQEQQRSGKGKGFKRDNIVTNIVRSYTKSDW